MMVFAEEGGTEDSCCTYQMLITECVALPTNACKPWLQKLIGVGSWATSQNLFTSSRIYFLSL